MNASQMFPASVALSRHSAFVGIELGTLAAVAAALLVYVSGSFVVTEILGVKRELEGILTVPVAVAAAYYSVRQPRALFNPLFGFVIIKTAVEIALRHQWIWVLDDLATLVALTVVLSAPPRCVTAGAKAIAIVAGTFATMALVQFVWLLLSPEVDRFGFDDASFVGADFTVRHPIALLGLFTDEHYRFFGYTVHRLHSFATEPSLCVVYFLLPAIVGWLLRTRGWVTLGVVALAFSLLSLAGSVFLSLGFAVGWLVLIRFVPLRFALIYGLPALLVGFLYGIKTAGFDALFQAIRFISRYGEFLNKSESLVSRAGGAVVSFDTALQVPFGGPAHPELPGPWLVNSAIEAGWVGVILLIVFLGQMARELTLLNKSYRQWSAPRMGGLLLLGALSTIVVFNDYQMSNYAGLVLLGFIYRLMVIDNRENEATA